MYQTAVGLFYFFLAFFVVSWFAVACPQQLPIFAKPLIAGASSAVADWHAY